MTLSRTKFSARIQVLENSYPLKRSPSKMKTYLYLFLHLEREGDVIHVLDTS